MKKIKKIKNITTQKEKRKAEKMFVYHLKSQAQNVFIIGDIIAARVRIFQLSLRKNLTFLTLFREFCPNKQKISLFLRF